MGATLDGEWELGDTLVGEWELGATLDGAWVLGAFVLVDYFNLRYLMTEIKKFVMSD